MRKSSEIEKILALANGDIEKAEQEVKNLIASTGDRELLVSLQLLYILQGKFDASWAILEQLEKEQPNNRRANFNRGWAYLARGDFQKGLELMEYGRVERVWGDSHAFEKATCPPWDGRKDISGKHAIVYMEGGYGDEFIGARFVNDVIDRGAIVTLMCSMKNVSIFSRMFKCSIASKEAGAGIHHDTWIPAFSFPRLLGYTYETLPGGPYIKPDPLHVKKWSHIIKSNKFKVGLRWRGLRAFEHQQFRKFPFEMFLNAVDQRHVDLFSLQLSDCSDVPLFKYPQINNLEPFIDSWEDTAGAIENLDLVVTSCTSTAHLSAAMGKPTWIILPIQPYYIWAYQGNKSPWYDSVTLFRQEKYNEWREPFAKLRHHIEDLRNGVEAIGQAHRAQTGNGQTLRKVA